MRVPKTGYMWLDSAWVPPPFRSDLIRPPYMVINGSPDGSEIPAREYFPLRDQSSLFRRFRDLPLDPAAMLNFANQYGWIGETGRLNHGRRKSISAVGYQTWRMEIQAMILADHLWECIRRKDRRTLRKYFMWDRVHFDVRMSIGMREREIYPADLSVGKVSVPAWHSWLISPQEVQSLQAVGWHHGDVLGPAHVALMNVINPRLSTFCHPRLYLDHLGKFTGHLSPDNLLGCIWMQFYLTVIGQLKLRRCTVCGLEMDVSESRRTRKMHDTCSARERQQRWRVKKRLADEKQL